MAANVSAWNSHNWDMREVEVAPGLPAIQRTCENCSRHFINEKANNARYAVHVGIRGFDRLSDEVTERWLAQPCPGNRPDRDYADFETRFAQRRAVDKSNDSPERPEPEDR